MDDNNKKINPFVEELLALIEKHFESFVAITHDHQEKYKNIESGLMMAGLMIHPENQPPQFSPEEALDVIDKASESLEKIRQGAV